MHALAQDPLQHATERSQRYWISDGIPLIVMGVFWLTWGLALLLPVVFPGHAIARLSSFVFIAAMALAGFLMKPLIHRWKERVTFPRTGYIELRQPSKAFRFAVVILAGAVAFVLALLVRFEDRTLREWQPLILGLVLAAGVLHAAWKMRSLRLALLSPVVVAAAVYGFVLRQYEDLSYALIMLSAGSICVLEGALLLRSYLHAHPMPPEDAR